MIIFADLSQADLIAAMLVYGATHIGRVPRPDPTPSYEYGDLIMGMVWRDDTDCYVAVARYYNGNWRPFLSRRLRVPAARECIPITDLIRS